MVRIIPFIALFTLLSTTIMASSIEKQKYRLVASEKEYEIRYYPPAMLATVYSSAKSYRQISTPGFRALAGFIFGGNDSNTRIAMTSPVHMDINDSVSTMSFVMPSKYDEQSFAKSQRFKGETGKEPGGICGCAEIRGLCKR